MAEYPYSPELKAPGKPVDFDLSRPGTLMMLRLLVKTHQKQTDSFAPPEGIRLGREKQGNVPCFVIEPESGEDLPAMLYCADFLSGPCLLLRKRASNADRDSGVPIGAGASCPGGL